MTRDASIPRIGFPVGFELEGAIPADGGGLQRSHDNIEVLHLSQALSQFVSET